MNSSAGFFVWADLTNRATGGLMGLPSSNTADMRVVDVYRRYGDKLVENWVMIDHVEVLRQLGVDPLAGRW